MSESVEVLQNRIKRLEQDRNEWKAACNLALAQKGEVMEEYNAELFKLRCRISKLQEELELRDTAEVLYLKTKIRNETTQEVVRGILDVLRKDIPLDKAINAIEKILVKYGD